VIAGIASSSLHPLSPLLLPLLPSLPPSLSSTHRSVEMKSTSRGSLGNRRMLAVLTRPYRRTSSTWRRREGGKEGWKDGRRDGGDVSIPYSSFPPTITCVYAWLDRPQITAVTTTPLPSFHPFLPPSLPRLHYRQQSLRPHDMHFQPRAPNQQQIQGIRRGEGGGQGMRHSGGLLVRHHVIVRHGWDA